MSLSCSVSPRLIQYNGVGESYNGIQAIAQQKNYGGGGGGGYCHSVSVSAGGGGGGHEVGGETILFIQNFIHSLSMDSILVGANSCYSYGGVAYGYPTLTEYILMGSGGGGGARGRVCCGHSGRGGNGGGIIIITTPVVTGEGGSIISCGRNGQDSGRIFLQSGERMGEVEVDQEDLFS